MQWPKRWPGSTCVVTECWGFSPSTWKGGENSSSQRFRKRSLGPVRKSLPCGRKNAAGSVPTLDSGLGEMFDASCRRSLRSVVRTIGF